jgi:hypothetical protein
VTELRLWVNCGLSVSSDHVRIGRQRTMKAARCAVVNRPRWLRIVITLTYDNGAQITYACDAAGDRTTQSVVCGSGAR